MYHIGIDLGGTNIAVGLVSETGAILHRKSVPTAVERGTEAIVGDMAGAALSLTQEAGIPLGEIASVGIGSPGAVDPVSGTVVSACNLHFQNVPLAELMRRHFPCPVYVENDANCAAWAEAMAGAAKGSRDSIMLTLGTGVGGGIVIGGRLYGGFNHYGAEFGHMILCPDGEACACGKRGCLEAYASATALLREARRAAQKDSTSLLRQYDLDGTLNGPRFFDAVGQGDPTAQAVLDAYLDHLALGILNLLTIFQPEVLVVGGGISEAGEALFAPLRERLADSFRYIAPDKRTAVRAAALGNDAGIVGAALLGQASD